jgi:hypothetical protein
MEAEWRVLNGWQPGRPAKQDPGGLFSANERPGRATGAISMHIYPTPLVSYFFGNFSSRPHGAVRQDEHGGRSRRAERVRNAHLLRLPGHPLAHQQPARADHARDSSADPCRWSIPRRPIMPQPGGRATALHHRHRMVHQVLHEHAASLSAATHENRSRRLIKCAKASGDTTLIRPNWGGGWCSVPCSTSGDDSAKRRRSLGWSGAAASICNQAWTITGPKQSPIISAGWQLHRSASAPSRPRPATISTRSASACLAGQSTEHAAAEAGEPNRAANERAR